MPDINDPLASCKRYDEAQAKATEHNKSVVFDALSAANITTVTVEFDGLSDQGQIEAVIACAGEKHLTLPPALVSLHRARWEKISTTVAISTQPLSEAIETLCYNYLAQTYGGWENNDGAFGSFEFEVSARTIALEFNARFSEFTTHNHNF